MTSTRMWIGLVIAAALYVLLSVGSSFYSGTLAAAGGNGPLPPSLQTAEGVRNVFAAAGTAHLFALMLGILGMTQEFRFQTITSTLLAAPRRGKVVIAKMSGYAIVGAVYAVIGIVLGYLMAFGLLLFSSHAAISAGSLLAIAGGAILGCALYAILGVAVGTLVRNQVAAVVGALVWVVLVEALLVSLLPRVGKWLPGGALQAVLQATGFGNTAFLPVWGGVLLLLAYAAILAALAAATTLRRDVT
ncbi:MAG: hypothetical protein ABI468_08905 [Candidatus Nanopelagicales bacterium]